MAKSDPNSTFLCKLNPVTSLGTLRYDNSNCIQLSPWVVHRGPVSPRKILSSPSKWQHFVHPEGKPYFVLSGEYDFVVVTESNIEDMLIESHILHCAKAVNKELQGHKIKVPPRCELFLELRRDYASCSYYLVDHVSKKLFWLEDLGTEFLDIPALVSHSHLELALERLYWVHVEFFPMHHESHKQLSQVVEDLYNVISHGQIDRLTSRTSTFPYTADSCKHFLKLLSRKRGQLVDGYTLCYAARLVGTIVNQRFITFYGQQCAQLDRLQEVFPADVVEHKWFSSLANLLMWNVPKYYINLLDDLYMNEQVYADQWAHFISTSLGDWKISLKWSLPVFIATILLSNLRSGMVSTSIPSALSCVVSLASASYLHLIHQSLSESSATIGARYLRSAKSINLGFLPLSIVFSLPRAGTLWGIGFLIAQFLFLVSNVVNRLVALIAASVIAGILIFTLWVIHPTHQSITFFGSLASFCSLHLYGPDSREDAPMV